MNCCNDYGQCTQGENCPCRTTVQAPAPTQPHRMIPTIGQLAGEEPDDIKELAKECWQYLPLIGAIVLLCFFGGLAFGTYLASR